MAAPDGLVAALARAQMAFPTIGKNRVNPHFKSNYADLAAILTAVRPVLAAEGIALVQTTDVTESGVELVTALLWGDERIASRWPLPIDGLGSQQVGSLLSYMRRYQITALLGVAPDDDDDGEASADVTHKAMSASSSKPMPDPYKTANPPPDDWETRPLASMTFGELRGVAEKLKHPFSGGSKSELIRQLEPLVRAASGQEPWDLPDSAPTNERAVNPAGAEPESIPFQPTVFAGAAENSGSARRARDAAAKAGE